MQKILIFFFIIPFLSMASIDSATTLKKMKHLESVVQSLNVKLENQEKIQNALLNEFNESIKIQNILISNLFDSLQEQKKIVAKIEFFAENSNSTIDNNTKSISYISILQYVFYSLTIIMFFILFVFIYYQRKKSDLEFSLKTDSITEQNNQLLLQTSQLSKIKKRISTALKQKEKKKKK